MPRPKGSPNKPPRQLKAEAEAALRIAKLKERLEKEKGKKA